MGKTRSSRRVLLFFISVNSNIDMKQSELVKMSNLENKMKIIFEKMNEEKKVYVSENQKMTKELM